MQHSDKSSLCPEQRICNKMIWTRMRQAPYKQTVKSIFYFKPRCELFSHKHEKKGCLFSTLHANQNVYSKGSCDQTALCGYGQGACK